MFNVWAVYILQPEVQKENRDQLLADTVAYNSNGAFIFPNVFCLLAENVKRMGIKGRAVICEEYCTM